MKRYNFVGILLVITAIAIGIVWAGMREGNKSSVTQPSQQTTQSGDSAAAQQKPTFNKQQYSVDSPSSIWVVANKQRPLNPKNYVPTDLVSIGNGQQMRMEAAKAFINLAEASSKAGYTLIAESGYRSYDTQVAVYNSEVKAFGKSKADSESARPGYSEHQTGWAVDIGSSGCFEDCFGKTAAASWLTANAHKFGFILRYPLDKASITGYRNEPWHFRYVGVALADQIHGSDLTLEQFFGLPAAPNY